MIYSFISNYKIYFYNISAKRNTTSYTKHCQPAKIEKKIKLKVGGKTKLLKNKQSWQDHVAKFWYNIVLIKYVVSAPYTQSRLTKKSNLEFSIIWMADL